MIKVFVENEKDKCLKNYYESSTGKLIKTIEVAEPYPYPYGFILDTVSGDGEELDCYIITNENIPKGSIVECDVIGILEQTENGENDNNIIAVPKGSNISEKGWLPTVTYFIHNVFRNRKNKTVTVGRFMSKNIALSYIKKSMIGDV